MATVSGSASTTTRNPRHWQLAVLVMATLPKIPTSLGHRTRLFDHLVGAGEQRRRNLKVDRFRRGEIDHQIELRRHLDWKVSRLRALENPTDVDAGATMGIGQAGSVAHQAADLGVIA